MDKNTKKKGCQERCDEAKRIKLKQRVKKELEDMYI